MRVNVYKKYFRASNVPPALYKLEKKIGWAVGIKNTKIRLYQHWQAITISHAIFPYKNLTLLALYKFIFFDLGQLPF
jgi:hypothetical protein